MSGEFREELGLSLLFDSIISPSTELATDTLIVCAMVYYLRTVRSDFAK
jgi:hypothetical protein